MLRKINLEKLAIVIGGVVVTAGPKSTVAQKKEQAQKRKVLSQLAQVQTFQIPEATLKAKKFKPSHLGYTLSISDITLFVKPNEEHQIIHGLFSCGFQLMQNGVILEHGRFRQVKNAFDNFVGAVAEYATLHEKALLALDHLRTSIASDYTNA